MDFSKSFEQFQKMANIDGLDMTKYSAVNKEAMESLMRMNEMATSRLEQLLRLNSEIATEALENGLEMIKTLSAVKRPEDVLANNMSCLSALSRKAIENTQKYVDFCVDCQCEVTNLVQKEAAARANASKTNK